jgi:formylglycine-generating enzyme required for sulfatase activity/predicted Ser/Thr protein kinase
MGNTIMSPRHQPWPTGAKIRVRMTEWLQILNRYRDGAVSRDELLAAVDSLLRTGVGPDAMLEMLDREHVRRPLPVDSVELIEARIRAAADQTLIEALANDESTQVMPGAVDTTRFMARGASPLGGHRTSVGVNDVLQHRFKLVQLVGEGGMSDVYKAIDLRKVEAGARDPYLAVKVLTARFDDYFSSLAVMHQEASKLQTLTHPNIVRVIDWDRDGQTVFMTMEYLDGTPLKFGIKRETAAPTMSREQALRVIAQTAAALDFAHRKEIVHGDLKPGNIIVTPAGDAKVIDFGIARFLRRSHEEPDAEDWRDRYNALTPHYASPEMHDGADPDPRDDVYALACITHELLAGVHPFQGVSSATAREAGLQLAASKFLKPREYRALQNALAFERERRTPGALQFLADLTGERRQAHPGRGARLTAIVAVALGLLGFVWVKFFAPPAVRSAPLAAGDVFRDCPTCPLMITLAPGSYTQGSSPGDAGVQPFEQPAHAVNIAAPLAAGVYEVTVGEYSEFARDNPRTSEGCMVYDGEWRLHASVNWRNAVPGQMSSHPVTCVSHHDASAYAEWLTKRTGHAYRLPSAAEWEYFARAGGGLPWSRAVDACQNANAADATAAQTYPGWVAFECADSYVRSAPVGTFRVNAFGLADTLGNVFEWTQDCWRDDYANVPVDGSPVRDGDCAQREARGGSWFTPPEFVRPAYRNRFDTGYQATSLGFRLVREIGNAR